MQKKYAEMDVFILGKLVQKLRQISILVIGTVDMRE